MIIVTARNVSVLIDDDPSDALASRRAHDTSLAMIHAKTLLLNDGRDVMPETVDTSREFLVSRESQIIGLARVLCAASIRETHEPEVKLEQT